MPTLLGKVAGLYYVWDTATLTWVRGTQPILEAGSVTIPGTVTVTGTLTAVGPLTDDELRASLVPILVDALKLTPESGSVASQGNNTVITPAAGKKLRVYYLSYNPALAVEAAFRFGAAGTLFLRNSVPAGSVVAKDFNAARYVEGAADEVLTLNLSSAVTTTWNAFYTEVA